VAAGEFRPCDADRVGGPSSAVLAFGDGYIGRECLLTADEILALARRAGIVAAASVLDTGSGTRGHACYLAREIGCRVQGVDVSAVGHAQAQVRARGIGLGHLLALRFDDVHAVDLPAASFDVIIGLEAWCHIPRRRGSSSAAPSRFDLEDVSRSMTT
jgi:2-polyprenyl-3-methyl-5-hydroxy-6-metoxy-1,4-benzoquinol methylase